MDIFTDASIKEIPKLLEGILLLALAWFVGQRLSVFWNIRQKRKEHDLTTARDFHDLYGEFFAIWKLWNYYRRDIGPEAFPDGSRWDLLERSCKAEGKLESILVRITCEKYLGDKERESLGRFRQLYQQLRESIRDNQALAWDSSSHGAYVEFKTLAPQIAALIVGAEFGNEASSKNLIEITSNRHEQAAPHRGR